MERPYWRNEEILAEVQGLDLTQVVNFGTEQLLNGSGTTLLCFGHGNVDATMVCMHKRAISSIDLLLPVYYACGINVSVKMDLSKFLL